MVMSSYYKYTTDSSNGNDYVYYNGNLDIAFIKVDPANSRVYPKPEKSEIKDEVLKIIASNYFIRNQFVWLMNREKQIYNGKEIEALQIHYGLLPYIYDPINGSPSDSEIPVYEGWYEALITDCIEYCDKRMSAANVIKFALTCLADITEKRLTIIVKKKFGLNEDDIIDMANMAGVNEIWHPDQFNEVEDRICIAVK